ncbi:MAG: hypothetical protein KC656_33480 [Myxococcales bacterium]|nr:hypothetical protein [Myxococcales bacterium]
MSANEAPDRASVLADVCALLTAGQRQDAETVLTERYPFSSTAKGSRQYTPFQSMQVFLRDGFVDRYAGTRLVHPAVLRLLSWTLPTSFPAHKNWKMSATHPAYWELFPTIDHIVPVARGGEDAPANWVSTSMLLNSAKANAMLDEIGWSLGPPGSLDEWDGLTSWLMQTWSADPDLAGFPEEGRSQHLSYVTRWCRATRRALDG